MLHASEIRREARRFGVTGRNLPARARAAANAIAQAAPEPPPADLLPFDKRRHKFNAEPVTRNGRHYGSTAEADRHPELELMHQVGLIGPVRCQVTFHLVAGITYRADYVYEENGRTIVEDVKGATCPRWEIVQKLWRLFGHGTLRVTKRRGKHGRFFVVREIAPERPCCAGCGVEQHPEAWEGIVHKQNRRSVREGAR